MEEKKMQTKAQIKRSAETLDEFAARINNKKTKRNGNAGMSSINRRKR